MKVNVLGTEYTIVERKLNGDSKLERLNAYCDTSIKLIVIRDVKEVEDDEDSQEDLQVYKSRLLRHELIHAFLFESGLDDDWVINEQMIDFFAMQFEKMAEAFGSVGALYKHQSYPRVGIDKVSVAMEEAECGVGGLHV
ncbi:hypothetical protein [Metaclostridioides mangenotii]|uniref:hypothetical protein n=1 Tax=Metaclostridioides mangenotii TaxID=1540 RepID=UPI0026F1D811|nr:hypothetical protein [Clostridioides mangenotii]